ncbi:S41 family peptidase [Soehngenia saccharolytica]|nr:S41 family peptidase [Soehngenia saccharolytica]
MKKKMNRLLIFLLVLTILLPSASFAQSGIDYGYVDFIVEYINSYYIKDIDYETHQNNILKGLLQNLDPYSDYYTKEEYEDFINSLNQSFAGIGIVIKLQNKDVVIDKVLDNTPAQAQGLKAGDVIISINYQKVEGLSLDQVTSLLRGKAGNIVRIEIKRDGELKVFKVRREKIEISPVEYDVSKGVGYIKLNSFSDKASDKVKEALDYIDTVGTKKVILDLRDNPGGYLDEAVKVASLFVPKGPIVHIKDKYGNVQSYYSNLEKTKYELVVLVNHNSASASEIVAAAVKDTKAGYIIGTKTYGKGTVQNIVQLPKGDAMKLTVAEYFSPKWVKINGVGVTPDLIVENETFDTQLEKAINYLNN